MSPGFMADHLHEVEVIVSGVVVHRHGLVFIGPPGEVTVRHRIRPLERHVGTDTQPVPEPDDWAWYDPEEWDWEEDTIPRD